MAYLLISFGLQQFFPLLNLKFLARLIALQGLAQLILQSALSLSLIVRMHLECSTLQLLREFLKYVVFDLIPILLSFPSNWTFWLRSVIKVLTSNIHLKRLNVLNLQFLSLVDRKYSSPMKYSFLIADEYFHLRRPNGTLPFLPWGLMTQPSRLFFAFRKVVRGLVLLQQVSLDFLPLSWWLDLQT